MNPKTTFVAISLAFSMAFGGALACSEQGPLEKAGEKIDETMDDVMHPGEGPVEEAGRKAGEKLDELKDAVSE